jgi:hypothetical protein
MPWKATLNRRRLLAGALAGAPALAITAPAPPHLTASAAVAHPDAVLLAAEQQIALLRAQLAAEDSDEDDSYGPVFELEDLIAHTPAATLVGAAVKLRWLADEIVVMTGNEDDMTRVCCRQVIALLERELGEGGDGVRAA